MATYTGKVTQDPGIFYAPYVPIVKNVVRNGRGTPWMETKKKFAFFPKRTSSGQKIWFQRYVHVIRHIYGPLGFPPLTEEEWIFTPVEYTHWALSYKDKQ